jgi:deazaflavin-dependent oxidoreductase (nitroreductase family)
MSQTAESDQIDQLLPTVKTFPIEGTNLSRILSDLQYRQSFHAQIKRYNPLIVALYKTGLLSLFGVSRTVMLLTTRGRKSGKLLSTPIGYFRIGGYIHLFSAWGKSASWYKNMLASPNDVWIQIGLRRWPVRAEVIGEPGEMKQVLAQLIEESPAGAHTLFGWDPDRDRIDRADFSPVIAQVLMIRFFEKTA